MEAESKGRRKTKTMIASGAANDPTVMGGRCRSEVAKFGPELKVPFLSPPTLFVWRLRDNKFQFDVADASLMSIFVGSRSPLSPTHIPF